MTASPPSNSPNNILHIVAANDFNSRPPTEPYLPGAYAADGFIHCTKEPQVLLHIANTFYKNIVGDVLVLVIDTDKLTSPLKWEPPSPPPDPSHPFASILFPHIYGPLNRDAIVDIRIATRAEDGSFTAV
jgi:uncharacterized protein (DUF952 family)